MGDVCVSFSLGLNVIVSMKILSDFLHAHHIYTNQRAPAGGPLPFDAGALRFGFTLPSCI